jgi:peptidoglycan/xylan/chitin deacetylase (PgdA/CDA1 family)
MKLSNKTTKLIVGATLVASIALFGSKALHEDPMIPKTSVFGGSIYFMQPVPILMYHDISNETETRFRLPVGKFEEQLKYIKKNNFSTITLASMLKGDIPQNPVVLTFDDISMHFYEKVFPLLKKYDMMATGFVIVKEIWDTGNKLTWNRIKELEQSGLVDIQSHTMGHSNLIECSPEKVEWELLKSKQILEKNLNKQIEFVAWPYGIANQETKEIARKVGYVGFAGCDGVLIQRHKIDLSNIGRFEIKGNWDKEYFEKFMDKFKYKKELAGID